MSIGLHPVKSVSLRFQRFRGGQLVGGTHHRIGRGILALRDVVHVVFVGFGGGSQAEQCQADGARRFIRSPHGGWAVATGMKQKMYAGLRRSATVGAAGPGGEPG